MIVVDDHEDSLEIMREVLEHAGARVRALPGADLALRAACERIPDVLLTDLAMPSMSGQELAATLRSRPSTRDLPIVAVTGRAEPTIEIVRLFDAFLWKPVDVLMLPDLVATLAASGRRAMRRTSPPGATAKIA